MAENKHNEEELRSMSLGDHLEELRIRMILSLAGVVLGLVVCLWVLRRRIGRAPLVGALYFGGTLGPALGFIDVYPMRFSFVADHFQYLASVGLLTLMVGLLTPSTPVLVVQLPIHIPSPMRF